LVPETPEKFFCDSETIISKFDELTDELEGVFTKLNNEMADATLKVVTMKINDKFMVALMKYDAEPLKHLLRIFTLTEEFEDFVGADTQDHLFEKHIVDFCFNADGTWLVICFEDG
jgi:hypothetical protein